MRRIQRPRLTWPRRPRVSRLRLPRWRQALADTEKQQTSILWVWAVRLARALCLLSGTALAGATFWYGYDGYLDAKCMAEMQAWDNLINLLDYCNQEGNDISVRGGTACENINRKALPEPPFCVARGNTRPYMARPTLPPDLPSRPSVHQNVSRAEPTVQDPQRTGKLIVGGWDSTTPGGPAVTPAASKLSTSSTDASPTTLISRTLTTLTITGHFTVPSTSAPIAIPTSGIPFPNPSALYPETATDYEDLYSQYCSSVVSQSWRSGGWTAAHDDLDDGDKPTYAQPTAGPASSIVPCGPQAEHVHTDSFHTWGYLCELLSTAQGAVEDKVSQVLGTGHLSTLPADWACAIVCAPVFVLAYALVMVFVARRYKRHRVAVVPTVDVKN